MRKRIPIALAALALIVGATVQARAEASVTIEVLSNRADLVSGGNALVEVLAAEGLDRSSLDVALNGADVTSSFLTTEDGRTLGLVTGLADGPNELVATVDGAGASVTITNHPIGGPVFSGPHLTPWLCTTASAGLGDPQDAACNAPARVDYFYMPAGGAAFAAYDPSNPPSNVGTTTTDQGRTVPYIIRQETGAMNRGLYRLAVLADPTQPWTALAPQGAWNRKLYVPFGGGCGTNYGQASAPSVQNANALSRGFMVASNSLLTLQNNCNTVVAAETLMMLKEHITDSYGEIRYTFGTGGSGGAIMQNSIANAYPGLLQGLTTSAVFPDTVTTGTEVFDCHLLLHYFTQVSPHLWANPAQQQAVYGNGTSAHTCPAWEVTFSAVQDPENGTGLPAEQTYNAETNPGGARGSYSDYEVNVWGRRPSSVWTPNEQALGYGFARRPYDNTGVLYGLVALREGLITPEQFVDLNEKVGGFDVDFNFVAERIQTEGDDVSEIAYRSGRINDGSNLDEVAIIDSRGLGNNDPLGIHTMHHSFALRNRMIASNGSAENYVIWRGGSPRSAFDVMDEWLTAVEADASDAPLSAKIVANKPGDAVDYCAVGGQPLSGEQCEAVWPYYGAPRVAAGAPATHDVQECQQVALDRSGDWGPVPFLDQQWERLVAAFPDGVCDFSVPSVGKTPTVAWQTYSGGFGGSALGPAPTSQSL